MLGWLVKKYGTKKLLLAAGDIVCTLTGAFFALFLTSPDGLSYYFTDKTFPQKLIVFLLGAFFIIPIFRYHQLYKHKYFTRIGEQVLLILKGLLINSIAIILLIFIVKTQETLHESRTQVIIYFAVSLAALTFSRILFFRPALSSNTYLGGNINRFLTRRAIAIGAGGLGSFFVDSLSMKQHYHIDLVGFLDDNPEKKDVRIRGVPVLGKTDNLIEIVTKLDIDEIYITIQRIDNKKLLDLIEKCKLTTCSINLVSNHFEIVNVKLDENEFHDLKVISISSKVSPLYSEKFKRVFDITVTSVLIALISVPGLIFAALIKLTSQGPVFFKTTVIGKNGKPFYWYKFRTMRHENDPTVHKEHLKKLILENHANMKLINDIRITGIGRILRKFSLDELPQLINVFKGDMSLVGPRPCLPYEYEIFKDWHKLKYKVIPGMTGLAQIIARNRKDVTFNDSVLLDLYYADNQSLWLDLKILFKTLPVMVFGKGGI